MQRCEAFFPVFRFHWLHASGATIGSYLKPVRGWALLRFHTGGSSVSRIQSLLPPSQLGGELESNGHACSRQLLPPSRRARTEDVRSNTRYFIGKILPLSMEPNPPLESFCTAESPVTSNLVFLIGSRSLPNTLFELDYRVLKAENR